MWFGGKDKLILSFVFGEQELRECFNEVDHQASKDGRKLLLPDKQKVLGKAQQGTVLERKKRFKEM